MRHAPATSLAAALIALGLGSGPAHAQFRTGHPPPDLETYEWTRWLIGEWEGAWESDEGSHPYRQRFEPSPDHRYIITHNERGEGPEAYRGFGVFSYYPATNEAYGQWFGTNHDTNDGWARRDGERMVWTIRRQGLRITRTRTRTGPDGYRVDSEVMAPDGSVSRSHEIMQRVTPGAAALEEAREVALAMPRAIDHADWEAFDGLFADDAVMFFPFAPDRADSKTAIEDVMGPIFGRNRARLPGPIFGFEPAGIAVRRIGADGALVTWHMDTAGRRQRRSAVLRREGGLWKIVAVHADNWLPAP